MTDSMSSHGDTGALVSATSGLSVTTSPLIGMTESRQTHTPSFLMAPQEQQLAVRTSHRYLRTSLTPHIAHAHHQATQQQHDSLRSTIHTASPQHQSCMKPADADNKSLQKNILVPKVTI